MPAYHVADKYTVEGEQSAGYVLITCGKIKHV